MISGATNFIGATSENNGVTATISNVGHIHPANVITVSYNGSVGESFYQETEFWASDDINVLYARNFSQNRERALFFISLIKKCARQYSYAQKWTKEQLEQDVITVPVAESGEIDFAYMETYICELETAYVRKLDGYLRAACLNDWRLSKQERRIIDDYRGGKLMLGEFCVGDLFVVKSNPQLNKECFKFTRTSKYPYFTRTVFNNGILGCVDYLDEAHRISGGSLAVGMLGMQFFYMEHDFYAGQFTKTVFRKDGTKLDEKLALWFASLFNKSKGHFQKGLVRDFERLFTSLKIQLPVKNDGVPDYDAMRLMISAIMKLSIRGVLDWRDRELVVSKSIIDGQHEKFKIVEAPPKSRRFVEYLPLWSFRVACGRNWRLQPAECSGWMKVEGHGKLDQTMFVVQAEGDSMKGLVEDGEYCVMRKVGGGNLENKTLLIQGFDAAGPEGGGAYALKKFTRRGKKVVLVSRNPDVSDIVLKDDAEYGDRYRAVAELHATLGK